MRTGLVALAAALPLLAGPPAAVAAVTRPAPTAAASGPCGMRATAPGYKHVIWIWMENHSYNTIIGSPRAPYINSLATECGLATNYHNVSHPSLPNYVSATSGLGYSAIARFDGFVFEIAARRSALPAELQAALDTAPIVLPAWDPMGALAR